MFGYRMDGEEDQHETPVEPEQEARGGSADDEQDENGEEAYFMN